MNTPLPTLLLRLSEAGSPALLWGRRAAPHFGRQFQFLLRSRVLVEEALATDWPVCPGCECGLDMRPVEQLGDRYIAICSLDHRADAILAPEDLRNFRIEPEALVREISRASGFSDAIPLGASIWELTRLPGDRAVILVLTAAAAADPGLVALIRGATQAATATVLLPASHDATSRRRIQDAGFQAAATETLLWSSRDFLALDMDRLSPPSNTTPRLTLLLPRQAIILDGRELDMSERSFRLLHLLAEAAKTDGRIVSQREIESSLWATTVSGRAASDAIRDLREHLSSALTRGVAAADLIVTRPGKGYVLDLTAEAIRIQT